MASRPVPSKVLAAAVVAKSALELDGLQLGDLAEQVLQAAQQDGVDGPAVRQPHRHAAAGLVGLLGPEGQELDGDVVGGEDGVGCLDDPLQHRPFQDAGPHHRAVADRQLDRMRGIGLQAYVGGCIGTDRRRWQHDVQRAEVAQELQAGVVDDGRRQEERAVGRDPREQVTERVLALGQQPGVVDREPGAGAARRIHRHVRPGEHLPPAQRDRQVLDDLLVLGRGARRQPLQELGRQAHGGGRVRVVLEGGDELGQIGPDLLVDDDRTAHLCGRRAGHRRHERHRHGHHRHRVVPALHEAEQGGQDIVLRRPELERDGIEAGRAEAQGRLAVVAGAANRGHRQAQAAGGVPGHVGQRDGEEVHGAAELVAVVEQPVEVVARGAQAGGHGDDELGRVGHGAADGHRRRQWFLRRQDQLLAHEPQRGRAGRLGLRRDGRQRRPHGRAAATAASHPRLTTGSRGRSRAR